MCGICGLFDPGRGPVAAERLEAMAAALGHRGPDGQGFFLEEGIGLGHTRLAIIDLVTGQQPMFSSDGRAVIVFNGEIYNYRQLRAELKAKGARFETDSDTEVILNLYQAEGLEALARLNGIFALALFDKPARRLILARDRLGIKPLYFSERPGGRLVFGSEVKALLASGEVRAEVDPAALADLLTFQNILGSKTLFAGVELLEPATALIVEEGGRRKWTYWELGFDEDRDRGLAHYRDQVRGVFDEAVKRQLVSDVPVGGYLSGGMDTGSIVAVAARHIRPFHTFTCGFDTSAVSPEELGFDERVEAERLSRLLDTRHHECHLFPGAMIQVLPRLVWHLEEPRVGISYQVYYAAALVKKYVTVVLGGVGGDEFFGGYPWRYLPIRELGDREAFARAYYRTWVRFMDDQAKADFFSPGFNRRLGGYSTWESFQAVLAGCRAEDPLNRAMAFDARTFLHGLLLVEDKLSMAHAVEARVPFLDNEMIDCALRIPARHKLNDETIKLVLKEAMAGLLPHETLYRRKQGFTPPDMSWYRGETLDYIRRTILGPEAQTRDYFRPEAVARVIEEHRLGQANHRFLIWTLLCFEWWHRLFIDGLEPPAVPDLSVGCDLTA